MCPQEEKRALEQEVADLQEQIKKLTTTGPSQTRKPMSVVEIKDDSEKVILDYADNNQLHSICPMSILQFIY